LRYFAAALLLLIGLVNGTMVHHPALAQTGPPSGLHIVGNHFDNAIGQRIELRGAVFSLLEYSCSPRDRYTAADYAAMQTWGMNAVKIPVNPNYWVGGCDASYHDAVEKAVATAESSGMYVMISMLAYNNGGHGFPMPTQSTVVTLTDLGTYYANDPDVLFETFCEPHDVSWQVWRDGDPSLGYVGMQTLVDTVNAVAPNRIVMANGMPWGGTLYGIAQGYALHGKNLGYTVHFYTGADTNDPSNWHNVFGDIGDKIPVVAAEFGDINHCDGSWLKLAMPYMAQHTTGYFAWAWSTDPNYCGRPSLISSFSGTPSPYGQPIYEFYLSQAQLPPTFDPLQGNQSATAPAGTTNGTSISSLGSGNSSPGTFGTKSASEQQGAPLWIILGTTTTAMIACLAALLVLLWRRRRLARLAAYPGQEEDRWYQEEVGFEPISPRPRWRVGRGSRQTRLH
jgi:hypothetical protein